MVEKVTFTISSSAFNNEEKIPSKYTADGVDVSPPLTWVNPPPETKSFALIVDDPDAPKIVWTHWLIKDIPATTTGIEEGKTVGVEIKSHFGYAHWGGPAPPSGEHRYFFRLYALSVAKLPAKTKEELYAQVKKHTLGEATLMGKYERIKKK